LCWTSELMRLTATKGSSEHRGLPKRADNLCTQQSCGFGARPGATVGRANLLGHVTIDVAIEFLCDFDLRSSSNTNCSHRGVLVKRDGDLRH
jgi:hypothetical protein